MPDYAAEKKIFQSVQCRLSSKTAPFFHVSPLFFFNFLNSSTQNPLLPFPRPKKHAKEENENKQILKKGIDIPQICGKYLQ